MNHRNLLALLTLLVLAGGCNSSKLSGTVAGVHDGDTLTLVTPAKERIKVRLDGIDAPELGQPFGQAAKTSLSGLVFGKEVRVLVSGEDKYKRTLGNVFVEKTWVNRTQVERGFAWQYTNYNHDPKLRAAQSTARKKRLGLWNDRKPGPPWDWRKARK